MKSLFSRDKNSWRQFNSRVAVDDRQLLRELPRFRAPILVAGCQRSGTTAVTRIIASSNGLTRFKLTHDDELDAALILSGEVQYDAPGRHCFQTTYLNDSYLEYLSTPADFQLLWVIRNPFSVVYSMTYHWRQFALEDLYARCGAEVASSTENSGQGRRRRLSRIEKACYSYVGKNLQLRELATLIDRKQLLVIDYDQLCHSPPQVLAGVFEFVGERYSDEYASGINSSSIDKAKRLSGAERALVSALCSDVYDESKRYVDQSIKK